jgi:hypothetical protein
MDLNASRMFVAVVQAGSLSAAANLFNMARKPTREGLQAAFFWLGGRCLALVDDGCLRAGVRTGPAIQPGLSVLQHETQGEHHQFRHDRRRAEYAKYHDRMPLILEEGQFDDWMRAPTRETEKKMQPYGGDVEQWEVCPDVGNVKNNRPELMERSALL